MSKKNSLARRKKQYEFDLQSILGFSLLELFVFIGGKNLGEKEQKEKNEKKLQAKKNKMKVDGSDKKGKKSASGFQVGKRKLKTKLTPLAKAKAAQAMELDK
uniref:Uncharacterized protein n=1 Tax=Rhizophora mucronata TaxID=61149 RepID=A0A2P2JI81_RHIMU